jgi:hypothetical protein
MARGKPDDGGRYLGIGAGGRALSRRAPSLTIDGVFSADHMTYDGGADEGHDYKDVEHANNIGRRGSFTITPPLACRGRLRGFAGRALRRCPAAEVRSQPLSHQEQDPKDREPNDRRHDETCARTRDIRNIKFSYLGASREPA